MQGGLQHCPVGLGPGPSLYPLNMGIHDRADSFVASTCFYIAEDVEYSEAHFHWPG